MNKYPLLISIPHGGTEVPEIVRPLIALSEDEIQYHADPFTREIFAFSDRVASLIETPVSRMIVDLNRPPLPLPLRDPDGIIKTRTFDGRDVYLSGKIPDIRLIHELLKMYYFPYHQHIDELIDKTGIKLAFDCHSMLPYGSVNQDDAGECRPHICLGNNGDRFGKPHKGGLTTCPDEWIRSLAEEFAREFPGQNNVAINDPFPGGFIINAHYWHKGVPWIQIEVNRSLYESPQKPDCSREQESMSIPELREKIWRALTRFSAESGVID